MQCKDQLYFRASLAPCMSQHGILYSHCPIDPNQPPPSILSRRADALSDHFHEDLQGLRVPLLALGVLFWYLMPLLRYRVQIMCNLSRFPPWRPEHLSSKVTLENLIVLWIMLRLWGPFQRALSLRGLLRQLQRLLLVRIMRWWIASFLSGMSLC
jgi:hypothetical protein